MIRWTRTADILVLTMLACGALAMGVLMHPLAVDDAFVTFRYAQNLATGEGFTYNPGSPVLSTTAPLYAIFLAAGALVWPDLPALANAASALALWVGAALLFALGRREGTPWVGAIAAVLLVIHPLLWLSLGLETALFLALAIAAIVAYRGGHLHWTAALLALTTLVRGDGLILTAVIAGDCLLTWLKNYRSRRTSEPVVDSLASASTDAIPWKAVVSAAGIYLAILLPLELWLTWRFGSPLPATLGAKVSQSKLGVTGFYPNTTYLQGLWILVRARVAQSPLYLLFVPAVLGGLLTMWRRGAWVHLVVVWGAAHLAGYMLLGVTPYYWYYAPLIPALVSAAALGVVRSAGWLASRQPSSGGAVRLGSLFLTALWVVGLCAAYLLSDWMMVRSLGRPTHPPQNPVSKVLPEAKASVYRQAGKWLHENTPDDSVIGVTELGIMGFYAGRPMVDFLGLLEPDVSQALARGDLYWALQHYQPDYLALTAISPLFAYDLRADPWFQAAYDPVKTIHDDRYWGSPLIIYERVSRRVPEPDSGVLPDDAIQLNSVLGSQIRLLGAVAPQNSVQPGAILSLTLYWQALTPVSADYTVFVHLLGQHERVIAQRDAAPGQGAQPTGSWSVGDVVVDRYLLALPDAAYAPDQAEWEIGLYDAETDVRLLTGDGETQVRFGQVAVGPSQAPMRLEFGPLTLTKYEVDQLALHHGDALQATLYWEATPEAAVPVQVTVQLVDEAGSVEAKVSHVLESVPRAEDTYRLGLVSTASPGAYDLEVIVQELETGQLLPLLGADGQPRGDQAQLTKIRFYP